MNIVAGCVGGAIAPPSFFFPPSRLEGMSFAISFLSTHAWIVSFLRF